MRNIIIKLIGLCFIILAIVFGFFAKRQWDDYETSKNYYREVVEKNVKQKKGKEFWLELDWKTLSAKGVIGWIYGCGGKINYPICYKEADNDYYLHRTPDGEYSYPGSIFMNGYCKPDFSGKHTILYGHNMRNGTMFKALHKYSDSGYYDNHKNIYIFTPEGKYTYKVYSRHIVNDASDLYRLDFSSKKDFKEWLSTWKETAEDSFGNQPNTEKILSLSTCTSRGIKRLVIQGYQKKFEKYPEND